MSEKNLVSYGTKWLLDPPGVQKTLSSDELSAIDDFETALPPPENPSKSEGLPAFPEIPSKPSRFGGVEAQEFSVFLPKITIKLA